MGGKGSKVRAPPKERYNPSINRSSIPGVNPTDFRLMRRNFNDESMASNFHSDSVDGVRIPRMNNGKIMSPMGGYAYSYQSQQGGYVEQHAFYPYYQPGLPGQYDALPTDEFHSFRAPKKKSRGCYCCCSSE